MLCAAGLSDASCIEGFPVAPCVAVVLGERRGEVVRAGEVFLGAHVEVVVLGVVEHGFQSCDACDADGAWGQSFYAVGVVGTFCLEVDVQDAAQCEVSRGVLDGGVGLQRHSPAEPVEVEACDDGFLVVVGGLFVYDACERGYLFAAQSAGFGLGFPFGRPEALVFSLHAFYELFDGGVPVDFVGVGDEECGDGCGGVAVVGAECAVGQCGCYLCRVGHEALGECCGELRHGARCGDEELCGFLHAAAELPVECEACGAGFYAVASGARAVGQEFRVEVPSPAECGLCPDAVGRVVAVDVYDAAFLAVCGGHLCGEERAGEGGDGGRQCERACEDAYGLFMSLLHGVCLVLAGAKVHNFTGMAKK